jgi:hypothetical protein
LAFLRLERSSELFNSRAALLRNSWFILEALDQDVYEVLGSFGSRGHDVSMVLTDLADNPADSFSHFGRGILKHFEQVFEARKEYFLELLSLRSLDDGTKGN